MVSRATLEEMLAHDYCLGADPQPSRRNLIARKEVNAEKRGNSCKGAEQFALTARRGAREPCAATAARSARASPWKQDSEIW